jgi:CheY-like chemotaxis protein
MAQRVAVIIDDEPDITTYLATLLADHGWEARTANSVKDGLALLANGRPDVVLLDLMMPERGGLNALVEIRKTETVRDVPVVVVSGIQDKLNANYHGYIERFRHYRPDVFLDKPVDPALLLKTLDGLVALKA